MVSEKQLVANRLNATKSTGPRTLEGKAKVRLNAKRDGITGQIVTLSEEDRPVFEKLKAELIADLAPKSVMELKLANSIAWDTWRLDHLRAVEMGMFAAASDSPDTDVEGDDPQVHSALADADTFSRESRRFALLSIYEQRLSRSLHKNLGELRERQAERRKNYEQDLADEVDVARFNDINSSEYRAPERFSQNGFLFSTDEVLAAANRQSVLSTGRNVLLRFPTTVQFEGAYDNFKPNRPNSGPKVAAAA